MGHPACTVEASHQASGELPLAEYIAWNQDLEIFAASRGFSQSTHPTSRVDQAEGGQRFVGPSRWERARVVSVLSKFLARS